MTANLQRLDPSGADAADVATSGNLTVTKAGTGTVKYETSQGMDRGSNVGIRFTSPATADQANLRFTTTAAAGGTGQVYGLIEAWPSGGSQEFFGLRTSTLNCARLLVSTAGSVTVQNTAGTQVAVLGSISLSTIYRFEVESTPATSITTGSARARIYDDADTLVYDSGALTAGNYGGASGTKTVSEVRCGDPATATTSGFIANFTQLAIDTDATAPPTISPVAKVVNGSVTAVTATSTAAASAPVVAGVRNATTAAVAATATADIIAPVVEGEVVVSGGGPMTASALMLVPTVTGVRHASVTAVTATSTALAASPGLSTDADVATPTATATALMPAPTVDGSSGTTAVDAVAATASGSSPAPTVAAERHVTLTAVTATATSQSVPPAIDGQRHATVTATAASSTALAPPPVVSTDVTVTIPTADGTALALAPTVDGQRNATVDAPPAAANGAAFPPAAIGQRNAELFALAMLATAAALVPTTAWRNITVTAVINSPRWVSTIGAHRHTATIDAPRWAGRIEP